jgi:pimeloyl-ACP methyl ester carboxylesterase
MLLVGCVALLPVGATVTATSAGQPRTPTFTPAACDFIDLPGLPDNATIPAQVECGYVTVPEQHSNPNGPTIRLAVAIIPSSASSAASDPLVMLQGGPGGSTIDTYLQELVFGGELPFNRDIILFNQRGTRYSEPYLACPEFLELTIKNLGRVLPDEEEQQLANETLQTCRNRLVEEGVNLSAFDSVENAADVDAIREALGYEQINLYGVSYGTTLALHVLRNHPEGLRSVILDAVAPPQINFLVEVPESQDRAFTALFEACAADPACNAAYPDFEQTFFDLIERLNADPVTIELTDPETQTTYDAVLDGDSLFEAFFQMLYPSFLLPFLPEIIYAADAGRYDVLAQIVSLIIFERTFTHGMYLSVVCAEEADFSVSDLDLAGVHPKIAELGEADAKSLLETCDLWNVEPLGPPIDAPVNSEIPSLILSGQFDPITPPAFAAAAATTLPQSYEYVFPNTAHGAALSGECPNQIIRDFLANPSIAPAADCIATLTEPDFVTSDEVLALPALLRLANLEGNSGPQLILFGTGLLLLLSVLLIWPIIWLVQRQRQRETEPPPLLLRVAPWIAALNGMLLTIFPITLVALIIRLGIDDSTILLLGIPASWAPLFIVPLICTLLTLAMLAGTAQAWLGGFWSIWKRSYFTLLTLAAVLCVFLLGVWGMVGAVYF